MDLQYDKILPQLKPNLLCIVCRILFIRSYVLDPSNKFAVCSLLESGVLMLEYFISVRQFF